MDEKMIRRLRRRRALNLAKLEIMCYVLASTFERRQQMNKELTVIDITLHLFL